MELGNVPAAAAPGTRVLGLQDFLQVLLTQLSWQDPLKPMDNQTFMAQMAQFTALEQAQSLNERMGRLLATQSALQSVALIGRSVEVQGPQGVLSGVVSTLQLQGEEPVFSLTTPDGRVVPDLTLARLLAVR
jgi:flagellar basal-body rod modification protein FlgD